MIINSAKYSCAAGHEINEDSCLCSAEKGIFIVADGLGGHTDGEKASLAAVNFFEKNYRGGCSNEMISQLMEGANTEVMQRGDGGKTTVAAAFAENGHFYYANAGDSRVYYFRDGKIIAQTKDHSVCQASVDMGMIRPEDIRGNEDRSRLLKVLGSEEKLNIKKSYPPIDIRNGDAFLICSDGFWEYVYETEMEADLLKSDNSEAWLKFMLKRHILRAENKGDNYTAVCGIFYFDGSESFNTPADAAVQNVPDKSGRRSFVPIIIGGTALIAAAAVLSVLLLGGNGDEPITDMTDTSSVSETTATETEESEATAAETEKPEETAATTTEKVIALPEHTHVWDDDYRYDDVQHWQVCGDCGEEDEKSDHSWDGGAEDGGVLTYTCTVCSATKTESIPLPDHTHTYANTWASDNTHHWHASTCGHANEIKDKAAHIWGGASVTKEPTETAEGEQTYTCSVCSVTKTESIPRRNHTHTYSDTVTKEASCTETGIKTFKCTVCGYERDEMIPAKAHTFADGKCSKCGAADPNYAAAHVHKYTDGKCECGEADPNYVPPHDHTFVNGVCECGAADPNYTEGGSGGSNNE